MLNIQYEESGIVESVYRQFAFGKHETSAIIFKVCVIKLKFD